MICMICMYDLYMYELYDLYHLAHFIGNSSQGVWCVALLRVTRYHPVPTRIIRVVCTLILNPNGDYILVQRGIR